MPDNRLCVAKSVFSASPDFRASRLGTLLEGACLTRAKIEAGRVTTVTTSDLRRRADHDLVVRLCRMPPDLAAPLLRSTLPALNSAALLTVLAATGEPHHALVAARRGLDWRVVKALIRKRYPTAMLALAANISIDLDDDDQTVLAAAAEHDDTLRAALLARPGLRVAHGLVSPSPAGLSHSNLKLLKLIRAGETQAFAQEMARRLKLDGEALLVALSVPSAVPLALASCALGLDRAVFLDFLRHWQAAHGGMPPFNTAHKPMVLSVFALDASDAHRRLLALAS